MNPYQTSSRLTVDGSEKKRDDVDYRLPFALTTLTVTALWAIFVRQYDDGFFAFTTVMASILGVYFCCRFGHQEVPATLSVIAIPTLVALPFTYTFLFNLVRGTSLPVASAIGLQWVVSVGCTMLLFIVMGVFAAIPR